MALHTNGIRPIFTRWIDRLPSTDPSRGIKEVVQGDCHGGDILCLLSTFDTCGVVYPHVFSYINELNRCGCDVHAVVTSPNLSQGNRDQLVKNCAQVIFRKNRGLDFGSWRAVLDPVKVNKKFRGVLLTNDSILGPLRNLDREFELIRKAGHSVVGMTESDEFSRHLQSYFLYFPLEVFLIPRILNFWSGIRAICDKGRIIREYEIGISSILRSNGVELNAIYPLELLTERAKQMGTDFEFHERLAAGMPMNPVLHFWEILLTDDFPFVKKGNFTMKNITLRGKSEFVKRMAMSTSAVHQQIYCFLKAQSAE